MKKSTMVSLDEFAEHHGFKVTNYYQAHEYRNLVYFVCAGAIIVCALFLLLCLAVGFS